MKSLKIKNFSMKLFPTLKIFWSWFSPEYDEDRDGLPQWKHITVFVVFR